MYRPAAFELSHDDALRFVDEHPLAHLVVHDGDGFHATAVPLVRRGDALVGHLARPNTVWQHPGAAVALFVGAGAYVSPRWYAAKHVDGKVVPTWNYTTVHVHGRLVAHDDPGWVRDVVTLLSDRFEAGFDDPWAVTDAPADWIDTLARGIVGIELVDLRVEGKAKLSQNRPADDVGRVAGGLSTRTPDERAVADAMRRLAR